MEESQESRDLFPAWLACAALPLPAILLWQSDDGIPWRFSLFFISCASFVAHAFHGNVQRSAPQTVERTWSCRLARAGVWLLANVILFSSLCLLLNNPRDFVAPLKSLYIAILSLCIVPYLTLTTGKPFAAVVFSASLVLCAKLLGCLVVVIVYGWDASERGYTTTPWLHPNLLVWLFWLNSAALCVAFLILGKRRYREALAN